MTSSAGSCVEEPLLSIWENADFANPESYVYASERLDREQWMGHVGKKPFAPWGDRDAPAECSEDGQDMAATCDCDARWKWGYRGHYVDGETVREKGRTFDDPDADTAAAVLASVHENHVARPPGGMRGTLWIPRVPPWSTCTLMLHRWGSSTSSLPGCSGFLPNFSVE